MRLHEIWRNCQSIASPENLWHFALGAGTWLVLYIAGMIFRSGR